MLASKRARRSLPVCSRIAMGDFKRADTPRTIQHAETQRRLGGQLARDLAALAVLFHLWYTPGWTVQGSTGKAMWPGRGHPRLTDEPVHTRRRLRELVRLVRLERQDGRDVLQLGKDSPWHGARFFRGDVQLQLVASITRITKKLACCPCNATRACVGDSLAKLLRVVQLHKGLGALSKPDAALVGCLAPYLSLPDVNEGGRHQSATCVELLQLYVPRKLADVQALVQPRAFQNSVLAGDKGHPALPEAARAFVAYTRRTRRSQELLQPRTQPPRSQKLEVVRLYPRTRTRKTH